MPDLIKQVCKLIMLIEINKLCTTPYHPEANGLAENFNRVLKKKLRAMRKKNHQTWKNLSMHPLRLQRSSKRDNRFFPLLNCYAKDILRDHLLLLKGNGKNQLKMTILYLVIF